MQAWTKPGPFAFEGKHYHMEYVNMWPRPFQQPHPPIWCPSQGSRETIEWAAHPDRRYVYVQTYSPVDVITKFLDMYRQTAHDYGYEATSDQIGWCAPVYVAETDQKAIDEARPHIEMMFNVLLPRVSELMFLPPGYMSAQSLMAVLNAKKGNRGSVTIETLIERGIFVCGSPDTVRKKIAAMHERMGFSEFMCMLMFGSMPADMTERNIRMFASEVMPAIKKLTDKEYRGFEPARVAAE